MRYEAKHSYFKALIQNVGNYINVSWSLTKRHQLLQCYIHNGDYFGQERMEVGPGYIIIIVDDSIHDCMVYMYIIIQSFNILYMGKVLRQSLCPLPRPHSHVVLTEHVCILCR